MFIPTGRWIWVTILWLCMALVAAFYRPFLPLWLISGGAFLLLLLTDIVLLKLAAKPDITRKLPGRFALGDEGIVTLRISNKSTYIHTLEIYDGIPNDSQSEDMPLLVRVPANMYATLDYRLLMLRRGLVEFSSHHVMMTGILGLFRRRVILPSTDEVKVYPNYAPVLRLSLLAMQHRQEQMGIVRKSRAGSSKDFHQLRDYRQGDSLAQIDWKATSRRQNLISRDFQEQMNQNVVFLLDCGRRMRAMDGNLPHFDHCLNALLLVAYCALKQGDHIAVQSFGGPDRWLPPVKGLHAINNVLNHLYDAEATSNPSDFKEAVERVMMRMKRRSLVVVLTNLRSEDDDEIIPALRTLQTRHLVTLASLREGVVRDAVEKPIVDFASALKHLAAHQIMDERRETIAKLHAEGVGSIDVTADELAVALANRYIDIKESGRL